MAAAFVGVFSLPLVGAFFAVRAGGGVAAAETFVRLGAEVAACTLADVVGCEDFEDSESRGDVLEDTNNLSSVDHGRGKAR